MSNASMNYLVIVAKSGVWYRAHEDNLDKVGPLVRDKIHTLLALTPVQKGGSFLHIDTAAIESFWVSTPEDRALDFALTKGAETEAGEPWERPPF